MFHRGKKSMQNCFPIPVFSFFYYYLLGVIIFLTLHFKITFISVKWHVRGKLCMHCCINVRFLSLKMPAIKYSQYWKKVDLPCILGCYISHSNLYLVSTSTFYTIVIRQQMNNIISSLINLPTWVISPNHWHLLDDYSFSEQI